MYSNDGDKVLTFDGNHKILTKVLKIEENKGLFEFYELYKEFLLVPAQDVEVPVYNRMISAFIPRTRL